MHIRLCLVLLIFSIKAWALPSFDDIQHNAQLSDLAYAQGDIKPSLKMMGHTLVHQATLPGVEVNYFLSIHKGIQFLTVRGTANVQNAMVDLDIHLKQDDALGITVHQGFANAALAVMTDVQDSLNKSLPVRTTGHSLGGAVAVMLAMHLSKQGYILEQLITFGQPKVTNVGGAETFENLTLLRVVTQKDMVPLVPFLSPMQIKNLDVYWHMGQEMILLDDEFYTLTDGVKSMLRASKFTTQLPNESNLSAHRMETYLSLIAKKLKHAKAVPYKTGLNIFGLSFD